jgi:DNA-binding helix-hairpin-helix protein with protein kinase domain
VVQLAWPVAELWRGQQFAGFIMERIDFDRTMELDYLLTHRQALREGFAVDVGKLVAVCFNLASVVNCLHQHQIAIVDLKPVNLKVYKQALYVAIMDCDGFQIRAPDFVSDAPQVTPEYLAPEFHGTTVPRPQEQDRFALALIIFRLLNYGIHPYTGLAERSMSYPAELAQRIPQGLYPYGKQPHRQVHPAPASMHHCLPDDLRDLFDRAFQAGSSARAPAWQWASVLGDYARREHQRLVSCAQGHLHFRDLPCASCERQRFLAGHAAQRQRYVERLQTSPARAVRFVRNTWRGTHLSPFQSALAQVQFRVPSLTPSRLPLRQAISVELVWAVCLGITVWWLR